MQQNKIAMAAAFAAMDAAGIARSDISTTALALNPRYEHYNSSDRNTPPRILGYEVHNNVVVTVNDIDSLGVLLDELVGAGVNGIEQVSFGLSDRSAFEERARIEAAKLALAKAEAYASAIGTEVTGVLSISEGGHSGPQPYAMMEMARGATGGAVPVSAGETTISATVNVVFSLDGSLE